MKERIADGWLVATDKDTDRLLRGLTLNEQSDLVEQRPQPTTSWSPQSPRSHTHILKKKFIIKHLGVKDPERSHTSTHTHFKYFIWIHNKAQRCKGSSVVIRLEGECELGGFFRRTIKVHTRARANHQPAL